MLTVKAKAKLWRDAGIDWAKVGVIGKAAVEIHLGINEAFRRQLIGTGKVPCYCVVRDSNGKIPGMANSPGFTIRLPFAGLRRLGATEDQLWLALGANRADRIDSDGRPACSDCLTAAGERGRKNRRKSQACWSCAEMIDRAEG